MWDQYSTDISVKMADLQVCLGKTVIQLYTGSVHVKM